MARFRLVFADDGTSIEVNADDYDDDGTEIVLYRYVPFGADPLDPGTEKDIVASFDRTSLTGPPQSVSDLE